jgi:hypothetical protein
LRPATGLTARRELPLYVVRPKTPLVEDIFCFDPATSKTLKEHGIADCLELLEHKSFITQNDQRRWSGQVD